MPKVLISDKMSPKAEEIFKKNNVEVDVKTGLTEDELSTIINQYDGLAIRSATTVTEKIIANAQNLKVIGRAGIGVDNIDRGAATANGVVVMNTPFGNSITTAEHSIAMLLSVARKIPHANASTHDGKWEKSKYMGVEVYNKNLGLIGCGNIGSIVADRAQGLKMKVIAFDPYLSPERAQELNIEKVELDDLLARADFISLHTPLNDATRGILNKESFQKVKKGVRIVNCARGGLIDEADLKVAIEEGIVAGAALDVFEEEPAKENVLFGMDQVICTPHLGASTSEAQENVAIQVAGQMSDYINTGAITNALNIPSVSAEDAAKLSPYINLGENLGRFIGQLVESGLKAIDISYEGAVADLNTKPITSAIVKGTLSPLMDSVNMVNAPVLAKDRGIHIAETISQECQNYHALIRVSVTTEKGQKQVAGSLFGADARVVKVDDVRLEASFAERMLFISNEDKPGLIGELGQLLGSNNINIANFHLGRNNDSNANAIALLEVDQEVDSNTAGKVSELASVLNVKTMSF